LGLSVSSPYAAPVGDRGKAAVEPAPGAWAVYVTIAMSGMCALGAEVVWTRLLSLMLGGTVYTFSIILAVFLIGLGIGSSIGSLVARATTRPRLALGACQLLLTAAIAWAAFLMSEVLPNWPLNLSLPFSPWVIFQMDMSRCVWAILPAASLWGASFPLALAAVAGRGQDPGRLVGGVYAANTLGAIVGALVFSLVVIGTWGTQQAERLLIELSAVAGLVTLTSLLWPASTGAELKEPPLGVGGAVVTVASLAAAAFLAFGVPKMAWAGAGYEEFRSSVNEFYGGVPETPWRLVAYGRNLLSRDWDAQKLYMGEGMNSSVAVSELPGGVRSFHVSGKIEASSLPQDMRLQRMLGHVPALFHPKPRSVLIVGCGAGVTAGSFLVHPEVEKVVICEIEPLIPHVVAQYFGQENYHVVDGIENENPHRVNGKEVKVVFDDARHYVLTTRDKFDIITSDPIHPWVKGAATLYTQEYFELCKQHLNPGGLVTQWVPLYESNLDTVKSEVATFFEVFPTGTVWGNTIDNKGYDVVVLGQAEPMRFDVDALEQRLQRGDHADVARSLREVGYASAVDLLTTYGGRGPDLKRWMEHAQINRDSNLRLQYLAGLGLNSYKDAYIYDDMLVYRKYPEDLFIASPERRAALEKAFDRRLR
jgi:spermidine synthase